jgi:hypothetical protein
MATSPELLLFLQTQSMMDFAGPLHNLGVTEMADLPLLNDEDLDSMGMKLVQIRKIRRATGFADLVSLGPADGAAAAPAAREAQAAACWMPAGSAVARQILRVGRVLPDATDTDGGRPPASWVDSDEAAFMVAAMEEGRAEAAQALRKVLVMTPRADVKRPVEFALAHVESTNGHDGGDDAVIAARMAAKALFATRRASASCEPGDLNAALRAAEREIRDYVVWRTQVQCRSHDRQQFMAVLRQAFNRELTVQEFSLMLHSHARTVAQKVPNAFLSNARNEAIKRRGRRPPRLTRRSCHESFDAFEHDLMMQASQRREPDWLGAVGDDWPRHDISSGNPMYISTGKRDAEAVDGAETLQTINLSATGSKGKMWTRRMRAFQ